MTWLRAQTILLPDRVPVRYRRLAAGLAGIIDKSEFFWRNPLANHKSAIKRHKQSLVNAARNRAVKTRIKNVVKAVRVALQDKNKEVASAALVTATSVLDKAACKGVIHPRNAARHISRLARFVNEL